MADGTRKVISVSEVTGMEQDIIAMQEIFVFERIGIDKDGRVKGRFQATGIRPKFADRLATAGSRLRRDLFEAQLEV